MQYQQGPPQQVVVKQKKDRGCLEAWQVLTLMVLQRLSLLVCIRFHLKMTLSSLPRAPLTMQLPLLGGTQLLTRPALPQSRSPLLLFRR